MKAAVFVLLCALAPGVASAQQNPRALDNFDTIDAWKAVASDSVSANLRQAEGAQGEALCLDYDFNGVSGYAVARRTLPMSYPAVNHLQYRLTSEGDRTRLKFTHKAMGLILPEHRDGMPEGWEFGLERIRQIAESRKRERATSK